MSANSAYGDGGALYLVADSGNLKAVINNTRLGAEIGSTAQTGNRAAGNGAAIAVIAEGNADTEVLISDSNFTGNDANKNGGAIYANSPASSSFKIEVDNTPFHENKVREGWGGAVWLDCPAGNVLLKNLKMSGNLSPGLGGAIYTDAYAVLGLENITFLDNQAAFGTTELTSEMLAIHSNKVSGATTFTSPYSNAYNNHDVSNPRVRVIFVDEKGLISEADRIVHFNDKITRPDTGNVNTGTLSLTGWYTAPDGSTTWDFDADRISGNLTLYAGWSQSGGGNGGNNGGGNNTGDGGDNSGDGGSGGSSGGGSGGTSTPDDLDKGSEGGFNPGNPGSGNSDNPKISFGSGGGSSERDFYINDEDVPMAAALLALIEDEGVPLALGTLPKTGKTASTVFAGMLCIAALITSIAIAPRRNKA